MTWKPLRWSLTMPATAGLVILATLSARGRDDDKRWIGNESCSSINGSPAKGQWPPENCLEGQGCVFCDEAQSLIAQKTDAEGDGPKMTPQVHWNCAGDRVIGVCVGTGNSYCDMSFPYVDGVCAGAIRGLIEQPER